ncbi:MAG: hypothetical protein KDC38_13510, partial [Planctomycetes bacterium]|nr:hypothetical protein [Planctomycetota bacterium]
MRNDTTIRSSGAVNIPLIVGFGSAVILMAIPIIVALSSADADREPTGHDEPEPTASELELIESIARDLGAGRMEQARATYTSSVDPLRVPAMEYARLIQKLLASQKAHFTEAGLFLYGQMLTDIARYDIGMDCAAFQAHARRIRHQALTRGDPLDLFFPVIYRLMEYSGL